MIVSRLKLKNWKNFRDVDVELSSRSFFVGPNASGKSNLLDVFRFLRDIAKEGGGLQKAVEDRGGLSKIRCLAARRYSDVEIEVHLSEFYGKDVKVAWTYSIGIKLEPRGHRKPYLAYEKVLKNGETVVERPKKDDIEDELRLRQTYMEQVNTNKKFRTIAQFFESVLYLHLVPQLLRNPEAFTGPGISGDPFGRSFLERVARASEKARSSRLGKIEEALKLAVPQLEQLSFVRDDVGRPHLEARYKHWRRYGGKQREGQLSDGTLRLIGLLWSLLEGESLLLLEEPELSLNGAIVRRLPALIYRLQRQKKRQVFISTHSADLLSDEGIGGQEVILLSPCKDGTAVEASHEIKGIKELLEAGLPPSDSVLTRTVPPDISKLEVFS